MCIRDRPWGKAYLSPVMDLYNNEIVAWSVSERPNMAQINEMVAMLEPRLDGPALLHSDQGWQYQQRSYQLKLAELGIVQSMSRKATCLDNACMEGFFGHMKDEFYRGRRFESFEAFKAGLEEYIDYWNTGRYQVRLKGMTPVSYTHLVSARTASAIMEVVTEPNSTPSSPTLASTKIFLPSSEAFRASASAIRFSSRLAT